MDELNLVQSWVMGFPKWEGPLLTDTVDVAPGSCGLFPVGKALLDRREDVLGNVRCRYRDSFLLRRRAVKGEAAAAWVMEFAAWGENAQPPALGDGVQVSMEQGKLHAAAPDGTATYQVLLHFTYEKEHIYGEN